MKKKVICHNFKGEEFEIDSGELEFRPSVYGVLIEDGQVLLSKQWDGYDLPGGGVNKDETIEEALKREFKEETGLDVEVGEVLHCHSSFFCPTHSPKKKDKYYNCQLMYFLVEKTGGKISIDGCDEEENDYIDLPEWISIEKIKDLKFYNETDNYWLVKKAISIINKQ